MNQQSHQAKYTFLIILGILAIILMLLPFLVTFNEFLTTLVIKVRIYRIFQDTLVPMLVKIIGGLLSLFGFTTYMDSSSLYISGLGKQVVIDIAWNCIGWQSLILLVLTFITGLQGNFTTYSKIQCIALGILGTVLINIFRISIVVFVAFFIGRFPAIIFHDYFSTLFIISWLLIFWWLSFKFVLSKD